MEALGSVTFDVGVEEFVSIVGPSGCGKTTLMRIIAGLMQQTSGELIVDKQYFDPKREVGFVFQKALLLDWRRVIDNVLLPIEILKLDRKKYEPRARELLELVGLSQVQKKKIKTYSGGMKQRLGIGLALLNDPKLLVLDEPVNGLDPLGIQELRALIRSFPEKGITVIISSHILSEIQQTADYIGIIAKGTVGFEGKLQEQQDLEALFMNVVAKGGNES